MGDSITGVTRDPSDYGTSPIPQRGPTAPELPSARSSSDSSEEHARNDNNPSRPVDVFEKGEKEDAAATKPSFLSRLAILVGLLVGGAIIGGTTYALVARVQTLIANATVGGDTSRWIQTARTNAYDACYHGCNDCSDPSFAYNACQVTARASVKGVICAGDDMWNWAVADKYPEACLKAVAQILMGEELERVKQSYRNQLAIIILTVLGGVVGGVMTYLLWRCLTTSKAQREAKKASSQQTKPEQEKWSIRRPGTWKKRNHAHTTIERPESRRSRSSSAPSHQSSSSASSSSSSRQSQPRPSLSSLLTAASLTALATSNSAHAYPCTGHDPARNQLFVSPNSTVSGLLDGWLSDCSNRQDCVRRCTTNSCSTSSSGGQRSCSSKSCTNTDCRTVVTTTRTPKDYVDAMVPRVEGCGFTMVDALSGGGGSVAERVGNARLEKDWWVRVTVNGLNVTRRDETDEMVLCLHGIGDVDGR
ncbi:hypothetical protein C8A00DRAFT_35451 [Chaetomidium leptoderma]|uniref:Uncharacterized protein n=1 Tax=Chaetomidium leptoderma TaxID=669021 RepID=A0AAN6ZWZ4_9PEZI|nr:hypothetical protein C8A00DRAFT_35451 [Chaetomidium leptoderma]